MDIRRSINTKIWADEWFEGLEPENKLLWLYLLTNQYTNMLGIYELTFKRMAFETGMDQERLLKAFEGFRRDGKVFYIESHVVLVNWMKNQSMNPNMKKACVAQWQKLDESVKKALLELGIKSFESLSKGLVTLPKKEKEIEIEKEEESDTHPLSDFEKPITLVQQDSQRCIAATNKIAAFFNLSEIRTPRNYMLVGNFVRCLESKGKINELADQFTAYRKIKEKDPKFKHNFQNYIGTPENSYEDGAWCDKDWVKTLNESESAGQAPNKLSYSIKDKLVEAKRREIA